MASPDGKDDDEVVEPSLDRLSQAFAEAMGRSVPPPEQTAGGDEADADEAELSDPVAVDDYCPTSPKTILEAILFVGHPDNEPIAPLTVARLLRGVDEAEVVELVAELNREYDEQDLPIVIAAVGTGFRLELREGYDHVRQRFYGRVRRARLSQLAVDILAVVAYNQPATRQQVDALLQNSGPQVGRTLNQLVRRGLIALKIAPGPSRTREFVTTERFLQLFELDDLSDLPRSDDPQ